ncbi:hypothetical protein GCM10010946_13940 [Undibacterium squillarum]|uniref:Uncharacterized protein n=1 Tax=Undibacterium squillarum TaxID=1131567 RepID=A0ABQ2XW39_9BURK|nr:hypothetical protein GCM10010946_13940 [Undibacterium squillarum]
MTAGVTAETSAGSGGEPAQTPDLHRSKSDKASRENLKIVNIEIIGTITYA